MRWICWIILQSVSPTEKASKFNMFTMGYLHVICSVVAANPTTYDWTFVINQPVLELPAKRPTLATHKHIIARDKNTTVATCGWIVRCFLLFVGWKYVFTQPMIECMATFLHKIHHNKHLSATTKQVPNSTISCTNKTILLFPPTA